MPLNDMRLRNLKSPERPTKLTDGEGLYLLSMPSGSRLWRMDYRFAGKRKTLAFGSYPAVGLADARARRDAARDILLSGRDPGQEVRERKRAVAEAAENTFQTAALRWFESRRGAWVKAYADRIEARLHNDLFPEIGAVPIAAVTGPAILAALRKVEARGAVHIAKRLRQHCAEIFRYAIAEGKATVDPSAGLEHALVRTAPVKHRARLAAHEMPGFLADLAAFDGERVTALAIRLTLLTMVRTNEIRFARKQEFEDLGGPAPLWRIPAERMKMKLEHLVPLPRQAVPLLRETFALAGDSPWLFPYSGKRSPVISENRMIYALYRMGYHTRATIHGFRGTASTLLNEEGFNHDWVERQLAHVEGNEVRAAYNAALYLRGRREMLQWWADWLDAQQQIGSIIG